MYEDEKTWKQHYEDWKKILPKLTWDSNGYVLKVQHEYRVKMIEKLVSEYEAINKN